MPRLRPTVLFLLLAVAGSVPAQAPAKIPAPEAVIGFKPGTDGQLADYGQILAYFSKLAEASDRVDLRLVGRTTEGRDMAVAVITAPENLKRIEAIREDNVRLSDPRAISASEAEAIVSRGKVIVLVNESIHSTEVGPAQAGMVTAHFLATTTDAAWLEVLRKTVILLNPCHNPDGYDAVVHWWNQTKDDPKTRGAPMPWLYHKYVGHDNNRDWFMFTQVETRVTVLEMHRKWHPQIVVDQHQMGAGGPRMFIPPYQEPWEPNVPPVLRTQLDDLGRSVVKAMTAQGLTGVMCNRMFDAWSPSRSFMHYHGGVRVLTEVASCNTADPVENTGTPGGRRSGGRRAEAPPAETTGAKDPDYPAPWTGGRWTLGDIVTYSKTAVLLAAKHAADHRERWLRSFYTVHQEACAGKTGPRAFLVPLDQPRRAALAKLLDILSLGGVEVEITKEPFVAQGRICPAGSLLIRNGQPFFAFARALFEVTPYPEIRTRPGGSIRRPYDVTAHNLPLLLNVEVPPLGRGPLPATTGQSAGPDLLAVSDQVMGEVLLDPRDEGAAVDALAALAAGARVERVTSPVEALPPGAFIVRSKDGQARLRHARPHPVPPGLSGAPLRSPRIGVYWSWTANMDEGWTRFFFDSFGLPFVPLRNADLRAGGLDGQLDVIVFANIDRARIIDGLASEKLPAEYRGGIGAEGQDALRKFVDGGGTLVALNASANLPITLFALPLKTVPESPRRPAGGEGGGGDRPTEATPPKEPARFDIPGAILWTTTDPEQPLTYGCTPRTPVFCEQDRAFVLDDSAGPRPDLSFPVRYAADDIVACGFAEGADALAGHAAVAVAQVGKGRVVLFSFSPQFRGQTWATYPMLLNALLLGR